MIQNYIFCLILIALPVSSVVNGNMGVSFGISNLGLNNTNLQTNSLNPSEPIYQAMTGEFLAAKDIATKPYKVAEESIFEQGAMSNVGRSF